MEWSKGTDEIQVVMMTSGRCPGEMMPAGVFHRARGVSRVEGGKKGNLDRELSQLSQRGQPHPCYGWWAGSQGQGCPHFCPGHQVGAQWEEEFHHPKSSERLLLVQPGAKDRFGDRGIICESQLS
jgi:hypothetical protein